MLIGCRKDSEITPYEDCVVETPLYEPSLPSAYFDYEGVTYPQHFLDDQLLDLINTLGNFNQVTNAGATLGRVLFYDRHLSANNTISCASCHHQDKAFTDGLAFSPGFDGQFTGRSSMAVFNTNFQRRFFWDQRANSLEQQVLMPIQDPIEMGMDLADLEVKLSELPYYPQLFNAAFGDSSITSSRVARALSQFIQSIRSYRSKYDLGVQNNFADFTAEELNGKDLYFSGIFNCNNCHSTENFGGVTSEINGLTANPLDLGIGGISGNPQDAGKFKSVSLRNIELTAPYMHDGRFETLEEVFDFYDTDIQPHPYLDDRLASDGNTGGPPKQFNFTAAERSALIAFLKTLTDQTLISDRKYANPFPE